MAFTNSNDEICEPSKKLAEQVKGLDQELIDNEIFVCVPGSESDDFILGPCFKTKIPSEVSCFYPLAEGERLFHRSLEPDRYIGKTMRSWPNVNRTWIDWVDRVAKAKGKVWKAAGIYDAIQLSKIDIPMDKNLLYAALFFWSASTNSFHFRFGMMSPTVLDVVALTGFMPHGEEVCGVLSTLESSEDFGMKRVSSDEQFNYCKFLDVSMGAVAVTEDEHISFLVMWLSKYLLCNSSPSMMKEYTKLAFALSAGRKLPLAPLVLSSLYHVCRDIVVNEFDGGGGPLWLLQFWIQSYFPEYRPLISDAVSAPMYGYPLAKGVLRAKTFNQCFTFFLTCSSRPPSQFTPFSSGTYGPEWFKKSLHPKFHKLLHSKEVNDIWASYLLPRDLHYSLLVDGSPNCKCICKCTLEHYNPNQFARQFGMTQAVPLPLSLDRVEEADSMLDRLKRKFSFVHFNVNPKTTLFFYSWWSAYIRSTQTSSPEKIISKTPPTIVNLSSHAMRARHEQSAAEFASNKKMKCEGNSVCSQAPFLNRRKPPHNKAGKPSIKKGNTQTFKKISKPSMHREGKPIVKSVPVALYSSKPSVETVVQGKTDRGTSVLDDDTPSSASSFTSEEEVDRTMPCPSLAETGGNKFLVSSTISDEMPIKLSNVEDFFAKVETQIRKAQCLSYSACHSPPMDDETSALNTSPPSAEMLAKAKDDIARFLLMPFQDVLAAENFSALNAALSTYTAASDLSIDTTFALKTLKTSLPDLCSSFCRAKKDQELFYTKSAKKVLLVDELKRGQELYHDLKDNHDKLDSTMDSIKNQINELKTSWKEAKQKKKEIQAQKLSLAKDSFTKCSALDEIESELPAMEQKKELADSDIARVEASWADFKHKLMPPQP
nr:uncharacterized protein LOC109181345 [Ipomoea batatas]